jgi:phosphoenolpyruvate phosphomutase
MDNPKHSASRFTALRKLVESSELSFLMEAHSGLSAKIAEEAGFSGLWASGLTISAALGLRDSNEASWTQILDVLEYMVDATSLPILVDGDTGHGNFNNARRFVRKLCERGIAGVCIEDKLFPKTNSFVGENQPLADIDEFCGRIKASKDSQTHSDFVMVARIEALISCLGMEEALRRAEAYFAAGADAILIHSKRSQAGEILDFARRWGRRCPLLIVPTMYYRTPTAEYRAAGISTVIWANHNLRAAITAMRDACRQIQEDETLVKIEDHIASVQDIFHLVGNAELEEAERRYLPKHAPTTAIVLAASRGEELGEPTVDRPKCMVEVRGRPLLQRLVDTLASCGIRNPVIVRGYKKDIIDLPGIVTVDNDAYATNGELASLACARDRLNGDCLVTFGDVLVRRVIIDSLLDTVGDIVIAVDPLLIPRARLSPRQDFVLATRSYEADYLDDTPPLLKTISAALDPQRSQGAWIGLVRFTAKGAAWARETLAAIEAEGKLLETPMSALIARLATRHEVVVHYSVGHWINVSNIRDSAQAREFQ